MTHLLGDWTNRRHPLVGKARLDAIVGNYPDLSSRTSNEVEAELNQIQEFHYVKLAKDRIERDVGGIHDGVPIKYKGEHSQRPRPTAPAIDMASHQPRATAPDGLRQVSAALKLANQQIRHTAKKAIVEVEYGTHKVGDMAHRAANPGNSYRLPQGVALAFLAGCYGMPRLFTESLIGTESEDLYEINNEIGRNHPFFTKECLRGVIQDAAIEQLIGSQNEDTAKRVRNAHHVLAIYIGNEPALTDVNRTGHQAVQAFFDGILTSATTALVPRGVNGYQFIGATLGICLAGILRYAKRSDEEQEKRHRRFMLAMGLLGAAIGNVPFPGAGAAASIIGLAADPIARHAFSKRGDAFNESVMEMAGDLESTLRHGSGGHPGAPAICDTIQEVVHRCGFPF
jgi:hypothetical protein